MIRGYICADEVYELLKSLVQVLSLHYVLVYRIGAITELCAGPSADNEYLSIFHFLKTITKFQFYTLLLRVATAPFKIYFFYYRSYVSL